MKSTEVNFEILCFSMWFILECECPTHAFARLNKTCHNAESLEFMVVQLSWISLETTKLHSQQIIQVFNFSCVITSRQMSLWQNNNLLSTKTGHQKL